MQRLISFFVVLITMMAISCSSGVVEPTEDGLKKRAEAAAQSMSDENFGEFYQFFTPGFREVCSKSEFSTYMKAIWPIARSFLGAGDGEMLEFKVRELSADGINGLVKIDIFSEGTLLDQANDGLWIFIDGQWWSTEDSEVRAACS